MFEVCIYLNRYWTDLEFRCVIQSIFYPFRARTAPVPAKMKHHEIVSQRPFQVRWRRFRLDWVWRVSAPHLSRRLRPIAVHHRKPSASSSRIQGVSFKKTPTNPRSPSHSALGGSVASSHLQRWIFPCVAKVWKLGIFRKTVQQHMLDPQNMDYSWLFNAGDKSRYWA